MRTKSSSSTSVEHHFDALASTYDSFKTRHWYYYDTLKRILRHELTNHHDSILDVGCGTGDHLRHLNPVRGVGIDVSADMIRIAKRKHHAPARRTLRFVHATTPKLARMTRQRFGAIVCVDVIEHMTDVPAELRAMRRLLRPEGTVVILMANPLWEPVLLLLERFKMKMPEGPHYRMPYASLRDILRKEGFVITRHDWRLALPTHIPVVSVVVNAVVHALPIVRRLGLIEVIIAQPA
jgi:ubiquinone/menaquinone biosynthesis C-methylase UbiE